MAETKNLMIYWIYFLVSTLACVAFLLFLPEWCWVMFPFMFTSLIQALDWM